MVARKSKEKVAMILLTFNQKKMLEETIDSIIKKTDYKNYKIFLVDNGSEDRHDLMVQKKFPKVQVIRNEKNLGYGKGNNIGIQAALEEYDPDYFVLLNDDIEMIQKDWLKKLIKTAENDEKIGMVGSQSIYPDGNLQSSGGYLKDGKITQILDFKEGDIIDVDHLDIVCVLVKKNTMKKLKGFDEIYTPYLLEDTDICLRTKKLGYKVKLDTGVKVIHKKSQTLGAIKDRKKLLIRFKNDIIFSRRYFRGWTKFYRIFVYLPIVAVFKKKKDEGRVEVGNIKIRKDFLSNLYYYAIAFSPRIYKKKLGLE